MSERLEEIKEKYSEVTVLEYINDVEIVGVDIKDLVWLINRVEELEEENEQLEDDLNVMQNYYVHGLKVQNERYKQALEFYAHKKNYDIKHLSEDEHEIPVFKDYGEKARNALESDEN